MIEQQGRVTGSEAGTVFVQLGGNSGCPACDAGKGCGAGIFGKLLRRRPVTLSLDNHLEARPGQVVVVGLPESVFLGLAARLYLFPILAALMGAGFGHYIAVQWGAGPVPTDLAALTGGISCAAAMLQVNRRKGMEFSDRAAVHLLRFVDPKKSEICN